MGITHVRTALADDVEKSLVLAGMDRITCFKCGCRITGTMVYWHGVPNQRIDENNVLHLHPECAKDLAAHLLKDALMADRVDRGKDPAPWNKKGAK
jgi:hypothetical protein